MTAEIATGVPLTAAQRRLWALAQLRPGDPFFTIPFAVRIVGPLDHRALERAVTELVRRHDALRMRVHDTPDGPVQAAAPPGPVALPAVEAADLDTHTGEFAHRPAHVVGAELLQTELVRVARTDHRLLVRVHHIVFDGLSTTVFVDELTALYQAFAAGEPSPLPEPPGYAAALTGRIAADERDHTDSVAFWAQRLAGVPTLLELPTGPHPVRAGHRGARRTRALPATLLAPLRHLAAERRATTYQVFKAACDVVLHRYGGGDVVIGMSLGGRDGSGCAGLIGYLTRPVVLRTVFAEDMPFSAVLAQVRDDVLSVHDYPDLPFEAVLLALGVARDPSHDPLFRVMFSHQRAEPARAAGGVVFTVAELPLTSLKTELSIGVTEGDDTLAAEADYRTDLFHPADVDRMLAALEAVLRAVVADPDTLVSTLVAPTAAERAELGAWGDGGDALADRIEPLLTLRMADAPEAVVVTADDAVWTRAELDRAAHGWAHRLRELGVTPGARVGVCLPPGPVVPALLWGVLRAGAVCVPLDPARPAFQQRTVIDDTDPVVVLADRASAALLDRTRSRVAEVDPAGLGPAGAPANTAPEPDTPAFVLYTAGVTDDPKPVLVTHRNLAASVAAAPRAVPGGALQTVPLTGPVTSAAAVTSLFAALAHGGMVAVPAGRPAGVWPLSVPGDTRHARYGCVETAGVALAGPRGALRPLSGVRVRVLDGHGRLVPPGAVGELHVAGSAVTPGYLGLPDLTGPRDRAGGPVRWHATGDLVRYGPEGGLRVIARVGERLTLRGYPVTAEDLVTAALTYPAVARAVAVVMAGPALGLVVARRPGADLTPAALRSYLAGRLPGYLRPTVVAVLDELPVLPGGAPDPAEAGAALARAAVREAAPTATGAEQLVARAWAAVLGREAGLDENFFEAGGNSLLLVRLRDQLRSELGRDVDVADLFQHSTVRAMASFFGAGATVPGEAESAGAARGRDRHRRMRTLNHRSQRRP